MTSPAIEAREKAYLMLTDDAKFYKLPPPLDRSWLYGIKYESGEALALARTICPHIWKGDDE